MTRNTKVSKGKLLFTLAQITLFLGIMVYADAFGTTLQQETVSINPNFI